MAYETCLDADGDYQAQLRGLIGRELRVSAAQLDLDRSLTDYGLDSLAALVITGEIEEMFGIVLEPTVLWDNPTIKAIAAHIGELARVRGDANLVHAVVAG
jgi:acyl carrier protein